LHFELVCLGEEIVNHFLQLLKLNLTPLPFVRSFSEFLPREHSICVRIPLLKDRITLFRLNAWDFADDTLIRAQSLHYLCKLVLVDALFICVELLEEGLDLILLPFDERNLSVLAELVPILFLLGWNRQWLIGV